MAIVKDTGSLSFPFGADAFDEIQFEYTTGDVSTIKFLLASVIQETLTLTYLNGDLTKLEKA